MVAPAGKFIQSQDITMTVRHLVFGLFTAGMLSLAASLGFAEVVEGKASYYADSLHGNKTASGEPYDKNAMTASLITVWNQGQGDLSEDGRDGRGDGQ